MKQPLVNALSEVFSALGLGIISGGIGGALMHLHNFTKGEKFKFSIFLISTGIGGFVGYIIGEFTSSSALAGIGGAISMKIFDIASENGSVLLKKYIEKNIF